MYYGGKIKQRKGIAMLGLEEECLYEKATFLQTPSPPLESGPVLVNGLQPKNAVKVTLCNF